MSEQTYRKGYYDGWIACLAILDKVTTQHIQQMEREGTYLLEDGSLSGDSISLAHGYAEEACERYAYKELIDWYAGRIDQEQPPLFPEDVVDAEIYGINSPS